MRYIIYINTNISLTAIPVLLLTSKAIESRVRPWAGLQFGKSIGNLYNSISYIILFVCFFCAAPGSHKSPIPFKGCEERGQLVWSGGSEPRQISRQRWSSLQQTENHDNYAVYILVVGKLMPQLESHRMGLFSQPKMGTSWISNGWI